MLIIKRDGTAEQFNWEKIDRVITKAFHAVDAHLNEDILSDIKDQLYFKGVVTTVENVQDQIENALFECGHPEVGKAFLRYRDEHKNDREVVERLRYMEHYVHSGDNAATASETDANANVTFKNVANLEGEVYKMQNRRIHRRRMQDKLVQLYPNDPNLAKQYVRDLEHKIIYAHDESQTPAVKPYCKAVTLYPLMTEGTGNIDGVTPSEPDDISSFSGQVTNLMFLLSSQVRGAVAMGDYIIALNYYIVKEFGNNWFDRLDEVLYNDRTVEKVIKKGMKQFIFGINQPAGNRSYNSPFSNLNFFDKFYYQALFADFYYPDGTQPEWKAIDTLQRMFMTLLRELRLVKPLTFPVTSVCMLHDNEKCLDEDCYNWVAEEWAKGSSFFLYLSNNPTSISSCCRVQNEITENTFNSTTGLTGIMTGSANVITLNLNRIIQDWYTKAKPTGSWDDSKEDFKNYFINILDRVYKYQIAYKTMVYEMEEAGQYSSSNAGYIYMKKLYCTIGVIGYCEAASFLGFEINNNKEYKEFLAYLFGIIQEQNKLHSIHDKKRPFVFNLEAIPGENLAVKLYEWDKSDGYIVPSDQNLYSSYFFKQWDTSINVFDKLDLHGRDINAYCGGGQACHIHLDTHLSVKQYKKLISYAVHVGCNYFTFNVPISECKDCRHIVNGPIHECPKCGSKNIDWWVRIIGFLRPMSSWSAARQLEGNKRVLEHVEVSGD